MVTQSYISDIVFSEINMFEHLVSEFKCGRTLHHKVLLKCYHYIPGHAQCRHLIPSLNEWAARAQCTTALRIAIQFPGRGCMDDSTTERRLYSQATWVIDLLGLIFDIFSMGAFTTRHWQTSGRLVQELNVCTAVCKDYYTLAFLFYRYLFSVCYIQQHFYPHICLLKVSGPQIRKEPTSQAPFHP